MASTNQISKYIRKIESFLSQHDLSSAEKQLQKALRKNPNNAKLVFFRGYIGQAKGDLSIALSFFELAIDNGLKNTEDLSHIAQFYVQMAEYFKAIKVLEKSNGLKPGNVATLDSLANCHFAVSDFKPAEAYYNQLLLIDSENWRVLVNFGQMLLEMHRYDESIALLKQAITRNPEHLQSYLSLASVYELLNMIDESLVVLNDAEYVFGSMNEILLLKSKLLRRKKRYSDANEMLSRIKLDNLNIDFKILFWSESGYVKDKLKGFEHAYTNFTQANYLLKKKKNEKISETDYGQPVHQSKKHIADLISSIPNSISLRKSGIKPVFIVGFFRTGSTLLERMLLQNQDTVSIGESRALYEISQNLIENIDHKKTNIRSFLENQLPVLQEQYLSNFNKLSNDEVSWGIDKQLFNSFRMHLCYLLFPDSPIINVVRHPVDTALSCYFHLFNEFTPWSHDMNEIASLMAKTYNHIDYCEKQFGDLNVIRIKYEDLVSNPEKALSPLLNIMSERWNPEYVNFFKNKSPILTASYYQVNEPLYQSSISKYKDYLPYMDKNTILRLSEIAEKLGYDNQ